MSWGKRKESIPQQGEMPVGTKPAGVEPAESMPCTVTLATSLGEALHVRGELTGQEDVHIDGGFEGSITLQDRTLTVGRTGQVKANVAAHTVIIEGSLIGDITADDKVEIAPTGSLQGNIRAARVVLKENSRFKGSIDTDSHQEEQADRVAVGTTAAAGARVATGAPQTGSVAAPTSSLADKMSSWS
jgi:cytoskeletal protein CcmA (bactofilin family)